MPAIKSAPGQPLRRQKVWYQEMRIETTQRIRSESDKCCRHFLTSRLSDASARWPRTVERLQRETSRRSRRLKKKKKWWWRFLTSRLSDAPAGGPRTVKRLEKKKTRPPPRLKKKKKTGAQF